MNDKTIQLLTTLAEKLGTTTEYLWGVLLKQAPISGVINGGILLALAVSAVVAAIFVYGKTNPPPKTKENPYPQPEWDGDPFLVWLAVALWVVLVVVLITANLALVVAALINPEYWALKQILN